MSLAQITEKIERDARSESEGILARAKEEETRIKQDAEAEVKRLQNAAETRFANERPEIFKRRDIVARLDVNKIHLDAQRRLIQDVFDDGLARLRALDRDAYLVFCEGLLKQALETGDEVMEISKTEKYLDKEWLDRFNAANNTKIVLSDEKRSDFEGGFVLNNGRICVNCSWDMLMQAAREKLETEVVKRLFPA